MLQDLEIIRLAEKKGTAQLISDNDCVEEIPPLQQLTEPAVIVDRSGYILLWYLPGLVSQPNQASLIRLRDIRALTDQQILMWENLKVLERPLLSSIGTGGVLNWRTTADFFRQDSTLQGAINLSPAWFQLGRNVR